MMPRPTTESQRPSEALRDILAYFQRPDEELALGLATLEEKEKLTQTSLLKYPYGGENVRRAELEKEKIACISLLRETAQNMANHNSAVASGLGSLGSHEHSIEAFKKLYELCPNRPVNERVRFCLALENTLQKEGREYYKGAWDKFDELTDMRLKVQIAELGVKWLTRSENAKIPFYDKLIDEMMKPNADPAFKDCLKHSEFRQALANRIVYRSSKIPEGEKGHINLQKLMDGNSLLIQSLKTATSRLGTSTLFQKIGLDIGGTESYKILKRGLAKEKQAANEIPENPRRMVK